MRLSLALVLVAAVGASIPAASARSAAGGAVAVVASGWSERGSGASQILSYGVVLRNRSPTRDALQVQVRVAVLAGSGLVGIYLTTIPVVPARGTFYVGNEPGAIVGAGRVTGVQAVASSGATRAARGGTPTATARRNTAGDVVGVVSNPTGHALRTAASTLYAVYRDSGGRVLGGERLRARFRTRSIPPHRAASFSARLRADAVSASRIAQVRVSFVPATG